MEFNITVTTEDKLEAQNQWINYLYKKHPYVRLLRIACRALFVMMVIAPLIVGLIILNNQSSNNVIYIYIFAMGFLIILYWLAIIKSNDSALFRNELYPTQVVRYVMSDDTIKLETERVTIETKTRSLTFYLENEKCFLLGCQPNPMYIFPKREIEKSANKTEFYKWIDGMKQKEQFKIRC